MAVAGERGTDRFSQLLRRAARYEEAGRWRRAVLHLQHQAPRPQEREWLRRHTMGPEGRLEEDVIRVVAASQPVWDLIAEHGLPEDVNVRELDDIAAFIVGRRPQTDRRLPQVSLRMAGDPLRLAVVRSFVPGDLAPEEADAYRYATWADNRLAVTEPFLVLLRGRRSGGNEVVTCLHLGATFLRYEEELGALAADQLPTLAALVEADFDEVAKTHRALRDA